MFLVVMLASAIRVQQNIVGPGSELHPLPIPDKQGNSIALDFIGTLPVYEGYDCIITITNRLGCDGRLILTAIDISAEEFAQLFFDHWYCENGLPLEIISDREKLFVSPFWKTPRRIAVIKLGMSTAFHPQTDRASERANKTVNQYLFKVSCLPVSGRVGEGIAACSFRYRENNTYTGSSQSYATGQRSLPVTSF
jgi:hypothetical protein